MKLSVVIPSHGGHARLPETVRALGKAEPPDGGVEIVIVDDASPVPPDENALASASPHLLRVIRLDRNRGRAGACNAGIEAALGEFVLILDDDMSVDTHTLRGHVEAHHDMETASARGVLGQIVPDLRRFRGRYARFLVAEERARHERLARGRTRLQLTDFSTAFFSAPRELLEQVGGFDEAFSRYGFEDLELGARLLAAGARLVYRQDLTALHRSMHAHFAAACRRHLESGEMAVLFAQRHKDPGLAAHLRVTGMSPREERTRFRRLLARAHQLTRRTPRPLRPLLLWKARMLVRLAELTLPDRPLYVLYHVVRDMHYAAGIERGLSRGA
ncbi:MAG: hypothetical protein Kow0062_28650 [Acidobacteriota bacterium]